MTNVERRTLTMSHDVVVDKRCPFSSLTLPELYKSKTSCTLGTGVTFHGTSERFTYKELYTKSREMAKGLLAAGIDKGDVVLSIGVYGSESLIMFMATATIGAVFSAPYINSPVQFAVSSTLNRLKPKLIIIGNTGTGGDLEDPFPSLLDCLEKLETNDALQPAVYRDEQSTLPENSLKVVNQIKELVKLGEKVAEDQLEEKIAKVQMTDPCLYGLSSGSTGVPKIIVTGSATFTNAGNVRRERWGTTCKARHGVLPLCCDEVGMLEEVHAGLSVGYEVVILPPVTSWTSVVMCKELLAAVEKHQVELIYYDQYFTTYLISNPVLLEEYDVKCLRGVTLGSYATSPSMKLMTANIFPDSLDFYGLSESYAVTFPDLGSMKNNPKTVGRCVVNHEIKVVDEHGDVVPCGTKGELWVKGYQNFIEYKDQPELTQQVKTDDGWFKTGDSVIMETTGNIQLIGRMSSSERFKVYGDVVYAQPIEAAMKQCPQIQDMVVVGRPTEQGDELSYCIQLSEAGAMNIEEINEYAISHIPLEFECPSRIFLFDKFPRTGSRNKISRKALLKEILEKVEQDPDVNLVSYFNKENNELYKDV